jgi:hypothetical protein
MTSRALWLSKNQNTCKYAWKNPWKKINLFLKTTCTVTIHLLKLYINVIKRTHTHTHAFISFKNTITQSKAAIWFASRTDTQVFKYFHGLNGKKYKWHISMYYSLCERMTKVLLVNQTDKTICIFIHIYGKFF